MKKNFFKKLSFVMALAMLISAIAPAAGAFAATSPSLNASGTKYLYLNETGKASEFDFNIKNKLAGSKYAWSSDNEDVATVDASGVTKAVAKGTAKISVDIKAGKKSLTLTATVVVRDNIKSLAIVGPATKYVVGTEYDFNRTFETNGGSKTVTSSYSRWAVDKGTIADESGKITFTEAGTYKVTVNAFQSAAQYADWKVSKDATLVKATASVDVVVVPTMAVAQADKDTFKLTFNAPMTDVAKNLSVYTLVGTTEVLVSTLKAPTLSDDKKVVTVDSYIDFTDGATYVVKYTGLDPVTFTAAKKDADKVVKVTVKTAEAVLNVATAIEVQLWDANNVDITTTALAGRVDFTSSSNRVWYDSTNKKIVFFTKGDTSEVTATFHTYKYEGGKEIGNVVGSGTIVGVDAASTVVGTTKAWTIVTSSPSFSDVKHAITVTENTKKLYVQLATKTGTTDGTVDNSASMNDGTNKFEFVSSDPSTLFIDNATGTLYPVKAGTVAVVIKLNDKNVDVLNITVGAERKATSLVLGKNEVTLSNSINVDDKAIVTVKVKDQYGDDMNVGAITVEALAGNPGASIATPDTATSATIGNVKFFGTVNDAGAVAVTKGTYNFKVKVGDLVAYATVNVLEPASATVVAYQLSLSATDLDAKSTTTNNRPTMTIDLFGYNGTKTSHPAVTGAGFDVKVTGPENYSMSLVGAPTATFDLTTISGGVVTPLKDGTYTVTATNASGVAVDVKYFTVKNTQLKPTFELKTSAYETSSSDPTVIAKECFKVSFDGSEKTDFTLESGDYLGTLGGQLFIKNLTWNQTITDGDDTITIAHKIAVNQYVNKK